VELERLHLHQEQSISEENDMILKITEVLILTCLAGFFDYMMDMIKDYPQSEKNWLWKLVRGTKYEPWYLGHNPLPFFKTYRPGLIWFSDAWHMAKHFMLLSFCGAIACAFGVEWYYTLAITWIAYWLEGGIFNAGYQGLKTL
jgi:hypothetical protein